MQISDIPSQKFPIPFAGSAGAGYIRNIPVASQIGITNGAASLTDGFPPLNFLPVGSGGVPPFGQDFNGLLRQITQWSQWQNAGGTVPYDSAFSTDIGGYPKNALLSSTSAGVVWVNTVDNNVTNPDGGSPTNWLRMATDQYVQSGIANFATVSGTANAIIATLNPAPTSLFAGLRVTLQIVTPPTGSATINLNGLGARNLTRMGGVALEQYDIPPNSIVDTEYDGTQFQVLGLNPAMFPARTMGTYVSNGSFTVPDGIYSIRVRCWGGGGGGGGAGATGCGGGGAGGGYAEGIFLVVPGTVYAITVGAAGTGGTVGGGNGGNGGTSSFGVLLSATGGSGGSGAASGYATGGNTVGSGSGGQIQSPGQGGQRSIAQRDPLNSDGIVYVGGAGGGAFYSGPTHMIYGASAGWGGWSYGMGGCGGAGDGAIGYPGGAASPGYIIVEY